MASQPRYVAVVCDLDGVVYRGAEALPGAVESLNGLTVPVIYATNNASRAPEDVAEHLRGLGLPVQPSDVVTSSQAGGAEVARRFPAGSSVLTVGGAGVAVAVEAAGLRSRPDAREPVVAVVQGYGPEVTAADLGEAAYAIEAGALWVATNTDLTLPTDRGVAPGNGSLVGAVANACGHGPDVVVGKPYPPLYLMCAERLGVGPDRILAVGDRLDTDIAGAHAAQMDSLFVLTGVNTLVDAALAPANQRPTYAADDLRALGETLHRAVEDDGWWVCGEDRRRVVDGTWEVLRSGSRTDQLTNTLYAAAGLGQDGFGDRHAETVAALVAQVTGGSVG